MPRHFQKAWSRFVDVWHGAPRVDAIPTAKALDASILEERILFSASPLPLLIDDLPTRAGQQWMDSDVELALPSIDSGISDSDVASELYADCDTPPLEVDGESDSPALSSVRHELVVVDAGVPDFEQLLADLQSELVAAKDSHIEILVLDDQTDGIQALTDVLAAGSKWDAVHIISHGKAGEIQLGNSILSHDALAPHVGKLATWRDALTDDADLMIYGCDVAHGGDGQLFVEALSELTGADVAASNDVTGHDSLGGDWLLEHVIGNVETQVVFSAIVQSEWQAILATVNVTNLEDVVNGDTSSVTNLIAGDGGDGISLREAILATNADAGIADTIFLSSGTYRLTIAGAGEDVGSIGDLDITDDLTVTGTGSESTILDGNAIDRVLQIHSGTVVLSDLTVQSGVLAFGSGGGIAVEASADLTVDAVSVRGNQANSGGGGMSNAGMLTIVDSSLSQNTTTGSGGGLHNTGSVTISQSLIANNSTTVFGGGMNNVSGGSADLTNVTISGNDALGNGGGIYSDAAVTTTNITVTDNEAGVSGGAVRNNGGTFTAANSVFAGNRALASRPDFYGAATSLGYNIVGDTTGSSGFGGTDQLNVDPLLDVLRDNAGPTQTHALLSVSTAIDPVGLGGAPAIDQRGTVRDGTPDIGAFEYIAGGAGILVVDTTADYDSLDTRFGDTSSINALLLSKGNDGRISLREAIDAANNTANGASPDEIHFNIPRSDGGHAYYQDDGIVNSLSLIAATTLTDTAIVDFDPDYVGTPYSWYTIDVTSTLPTITDAVTIDGRSQLGYAGAPIIELDGSHAGSNIAAGRRVVLPWGEVGFLIDDLNTDGETLMRRSLEWASGLPSPGNVLFVVQDSVTLNAEDLAKKSLMEGWGFTVNAIDVNDSQAAFDAAVALNDAVFITKDITSGDLGTKLRDVSIGVVTEELAITDVEFGLNASHGWDLGVLNLTIDDNSHYITSPFATGALTVFDASQELQYISGSQAPDLLALGSTTGGASLVVIETGQELYDGTSFNGLQITASNSNISGLVINRFNSGVTITGGGSNTIDGNYIGTDVTGTRDFGNTANGIEVTGAGSNNVIGGITAYAGNLIAGNSLDGIYVDGASNTRVQGNLIGTDVAGTFTIANGDDGVDVRNAATNTLIGGTTAAARNVISGNAADGIAFEGVGTNGAIIQGNYIGTQIDGVSPLGNGDDGVRLFNGPANNTIGGVTTGAGNVIAHNGQDGVFLQNNAGDGNVIRGNSIFSNTQLGIDLEGGDEVTIGFGVTLNDWGSTDGDTGPNRLQNYPVITGAITDGDEISISGYLDSSDATNFEIDFYATGPIDGSGYGEGQTYLGSINVDSDGNGFANFHFHTSFALAAGQSVTATATDVTSGTSEFAASFVTAVPQNVLWISTDADAMPPGADGLPGGWREGQALEFGGPDLNLGPATDGDFSSVIDFDKFVTVGSGGVDAGALHYVSRNVTVGSGGNRVHLHVGDVLVSFNQDETILAAYYETGVDTLVGKDDLVAFRPDTPGNYDFGTFYMVFNGVPDTVAAPITNLNAISLVEHDTLVGATNLAAGTFIFSEQAGIAPNDIYHFAPTIAGKNAAAGTTIRLLEGNDIDIETGKNIRGLELIESPSIVGGVALNSGDILVTLSVDDASVGDAPSLNTTTQDIFVLTITAAEPDTGTSAATATMLLDGSDVGLDGTERVYALALVPDNVRAEAQDDHVGLSFDGVDDHVVVANDPSLVMTNNVTMEAWINHTGAGTGSQIIVNKEGEYEVGITAETGEIKWAIANTVPTWSWHSTGYFVTAGEWTHIAVTYDGVAGEVKTYANGALVDTFSQSGAIGDVYTGFNELRIGGRENAPGAQVFNGLIDEVRVWSNARTEGEIIANMDVLLSGSEPGLVGNWRFDDGINSTAFDQSTFGNDGILGGGVAAEEPTWKGYVTDEDTVLNVAAPNGVLANDLDADNDPLTVTNLDTTGTLGMVILNPANGSFSYDPNGQFETLAAGEHAIDTFTYTAHDGTGDSDFAIVTISITGVNDSPTVAANTGTTVSEGSVGTIITSAMLNEGDPDDVGTGLTYTVTNIPGNGTLRLSGTALINGNTVTQDDIDNNRVSYDHDGSETSADSFNFSLADGGEDGATPVVGTFNIAITPLNDSPTIAINTGTTVSEGSVGTIITAVMLNEGDPDDAGTGLTYTVTNIPGNGTLRLSGTALINGNTFTQDDIDNNRVSYDHDGSETSADSFDFSLADGGEDGATPVVGTFNIAITPLNDSPTIAINTGTTVGEGSTGTIITSAMLNEGDPDDAGTGLTFTVTNIPGNGTLRLSGTALINGNTFTQDDIDNNRVSYDHDGSETSVDSFDFSLADGGEDGATPVVGTFSIAITPLNDSPTIAINTGTTVSEGSTGTIITSAMLNEGDPDDAGTGLTYTVTNIPGNGTLRLSGTTLINGDTFTQDDIDNNRVSYDHDGSETSADSFDFSLADGGEDGATPVVGTFNIAITPLNDSPMIANNTGTTVSEGSTGTIITAVMLNEGDPDDTGTGLTYTVSNVPSNGSLRLSGTALVNGNTFTQDDIDNNRVSYDHDGSETIADSFDFSLADGGEDGATPVVGTFNIAIAPLNDSPTIAINTGTTVSEGSVGTIITSSLLNEGDPDDAGTGLTYTVTNIPGNGTLRLSGTALINGNTFTQDDIDNNRVSYDHDGSETSADSFNFSLADGGEDGATPVVGTFNIAITPLNDSPMIANNTGTTVSEGSTGTIITAVMLNEGDPDDTGTGLTYTVSNVPSNGSLRLSGTALVNGNTFTQDDIDNNRVSYDHDGSETSADNFDFSLADGGEDGATPVVGTFNIAITPLNDSPTIAINTGTTVGEGSVGTIITAAMLNEGDPDDAGTGLTYTVTNSPGNGTLRLSGTALINGNAFTQDDIDSNRVSYDHDGSETSADSFDFSLADGGEDGAAPVVGTFNIAITPLNDSPTIAINTGTTVGEGSAGTIITAAMLNEGDPDDVGTGLTYTVTNIPGNGTLRLSGTALINGNTVTQDDIDSNRVSYDHDGSETSADSFNFSLADGGEDGATPVVGTFNIAITPLNDSPTIAINTGTTVSEGSTGTIITSAMLNEGDPDDAGTGLTYTVNIPGNGTLRLSGTALINGNTFTQDDIDNNRVSYDHDGSPTATDSFDFSLADGGEDSATPATGTFNITVTPVNNEETLTTNLPLTVTEGATATIGQPLLETTDVDNTPAQLIYTVNVAAANGTLRLSGVALGVSDTFTQADINAGNVDYVHDGSETTFDSFDFNVDDGQGSSTVGTFSIMVSPLNDAPTAVADNYVVNKGATINANAASGVLLNDVDAEGDTLTATLLTGPTNGAITLNGDGSFTYTHDNSLTTSDSFAYQIADGNGGFDTAMVNLTINLVNNAPVATGESFTIDEGAMLNIGAPGVIANDSDIDGDPLSVTLLSGPSNGSLTLDSDGSFTYLHDGSETISDGFTYQVDDGNGGFDTATANLTINPLNDAPLAADDSYTVDEGATLSIGPPGVVGNDTDEEGDPLSVALLAGPTNGILALNTDGSFSYIHDGSETTNDTFAYQIDDGNGGSALATVTLVINAVNDIPIASAPTPITTAESVPVVFSAANGTALDVNDIDAQGNPVMVTLTATDGVLTLAQTTGLTFGAGDGAEDPFMTVVGALDDVRAALDGLEYRPRINFIGSATIQVTIDDQGNVGSGGPQTATVSAAVDVIPDDPPVSHDDGISVAFGVPIDGNVLTNDTDANGDTLTATLVRSAAHGTLTLNANGTFTYTPDAGFVGLDSFSYMASDGVSLSQETEVSISVGFAADNGSSPPPPTNDGTADDDELESTATILPPLTATNAEDSDSATQIFPSFRRDRDAVETSVVTEVRDAGSVTLADLNSNIVAGSFTRSFYLTAGIDVEILSPDLAPHATPTTFSTAWLWQQMSGIAARLEGDSRTVTLGEIAFTTTATALSVGYVIWSIRSGYMLASMLSAMPAWQRVDPLPVLDFVRAKQNRIRRDHETRQPRKSLLESILGEQFSKSSK